MNQTLFSNVKPKKRSQTIQHIMVALDASPHSLRALEAASELAQILGAELIGIFVEDVNLLKLASLPFAEEINYPKATVQKLDTPLMEKRLREQASRAREYLRQIAERDSLDWTFRIARGVVAAELLAAAMEADLLVLGRTSRRLNHSPVGSTARTAVSQSKPPVLLLGSDFNLNKPPFVLYDGTNISLAALTVAAELARENGYLGVLIAGEKEDAGKNQSDVLAHLRDYNMVVNCRQVITGDDVVNIIQRSNVGVLVIGKTGTSFVNNVIETVLEKTDHPILVVR